MEPLVTEHTVMISDARSMPHLADESVDLVVTSPPYPMIEMWDRLFASLEPRIGELLEDGTDDEAVARAYEGMHLQLDMVWRECYRCLCDGGILCINIGDATRTVGGRFRLFSNHARITAACRRIGFDSLPLILWRKQTNAPNKFMGSGMYPPGAYVTLEHEYVLVFRKGAQRRFAGEPARRNRRESAYFWEERNVWFSDVWDFKGSRQRLGGAAGRTRSAAFPFELAFRLISMFSVRGDLVLDPFLGTGTTLAAAAAAGRNSSGLEIDSSLAETAMSYPDSSVATLRAYQAARLRRHLDFVEARRVAGRPCAYLNRCHGFPVVTRQETELRLDLIRTFEPEEPSTGLLRARVSYEAPEHCAGDEDDERRTARLIE